MSKGSTDGNLTHHKQDHSQMCGPLAGHSQPGVDVSMANHSQPILDLFKRSKPEDMEAIQAEHC